ncbi:Ca2+-binding RTX toxin-like protein [Loktanella ponticola]|uniref:Ca2+-binding RTX toxin-like protein n=1 Tax=Yoonia ponticola TaxID=1524255 RepID=A0A7W9EYI5_9RHOB|nr:Hint domain-containing protein [Yoonia ponticola]MBB5722843.1 Ca2+-binding RTX toxin-like protein [Yoonia ponticola]
MTNITIPRSSTTQTLTGDNGVQTQATFTANSLGASSWGRDGVGLKGSDFDPFGESALEVEFSNSVEDVAFTLFDIDQASGNWDDQIRVEAFDPAGNPIAITYTTTSRGHVVESNGSNGVLVIEASNNNTNGDNQSSIFVKIAGPVGSFKIYYEDGSNTTNNNGIIGIDNMSFGDVIARDGTVSGTNGGDLIDSDYEGDPNGDYVDNDDAFLTGDSANDDLIEANGGSDTVYAGDGHDEVYGGNGRDTLFGGTGNDTLYGDAGVDTLYGDAGDDTVYGGAGADTIFAGQGDDALYGGDDKDTFFVGDSDGTDRISGGEGGTDFDTVDFAGVSGSSGVTVTYSGDEAATYQVGSTGSNGKFNEIEAIVGTANADKIDATLDTAGVSVNTGAGNDVIIGGSGDDTIDAGTGNDTIGLNNNFGDDTINGGADTGNADVDVLDASQMTQDVTLNLSTPESGTISNGTDTATFSEIEEFVLGAGADSVTGSSGDDIVDLGTGADTINAGAGNDQIDLGSNSAGNPDGFDDVVVLQDDFGDDIVKNFDAPTLNSDGTYTSGDTLDVTDLYDAPEGDATRTPVNTNDVVVSADGNGNAVLTFPNGESITLDGISASAANDPFYLQALGIPLPDGTVSGTAGDDLINGAYTGDPDGDIVDNDDAILAGDTGNDDLIEAHGGNDNIFAADGDDVVYGGTGNDTINGGSGDDTLYGEAGDDVFTIGQADGTDTIIGGEDTGNGDTDTVDFSSAVLGGGVSATGVNVTFTGDEAATYQVGTAGSDGTFSEIEAVVGTDKADAIDLSGDSAGITVNSGAGKDVITSGAGDDVINAGQDDDTIILNDGFGNDTIDAGEDTGGADTDILDGSGLTDDVTVVFSGDEAGTIAQGADTLSFTGVEEIITGAGDDVIFGGVGDDSVSTGAGNDFIFGNDGADTIDAGAGNDTIYFAEGDSVDGGAGDDIFSFIDLGETTNGVITIVGGDDDETPVNGAAGTGGDILRMGDQADLSSLVKVSDGINASGNETFSGSVTLDDGTILNFSGIEQVICFTPGTNIATPQGSRPIETLGIGDMVLTRDHGMQPIRWIQERTVPATDRFAPVRLRPGVVTGLERDLLVSPQHRMLFQGYRAELLFGESEVLMPAIHLIDDKMVTREEGGMVTYIHMMFDEHEVIYAEGAASESFHPGELGLNGVTDVAREELFTLFPALRSAPNGYGRTARRSLKKHESQMLRTK